MYCRARPEFPAKAVCGSVLVFALGAAAVSLSAQQPSPAVAPVARKAANAPPADQRDRTVWRKRNARADIRVEHVPLAEFAEFILDHLNLDDRIANGAVHLTDQRPAQAPPAVVPRDARQRPQQAVLQNQRQQALELLLPQLQVELVFVRRSRTDEGDRIKEIELKGSRSN